MKQYTFYIITLISLPEYTYIGYTTNFNNRKYQHKKNLKDKTKINHPLYKTINDNGGWDNVSMNILEYGEYENLKDVYIRERELIDLHKSLMNGHLPSKIDINYSDNPKEYKQKWHQEFKETKPEKYKENVKKQNEKRKEDKAEWYIQNKEKISTKGKEKVICDICNKEYCRFSLWNHKQTHKNK
jgi:hypothetical protein